MTSPQPCRWIASDQPRGVIGEHYDDCVGEGCRGCWPCLERHCSVCNLRHVDHAHPVTCPGCVGDVRSDLGTIRVMCGALPEEVEHRGVNGAHAVLARTSG